MSICQSCLSVGPTRYVSFYKNIGMLVMRRYQQIKGNLCKKCIGKYFWQFTLTTLFLGWWGVISFIITPGILLINLYHYLASLIGGMSTSEP